jgi:hypothetical protein
MVVKSGLEFSILKFSEPLPSELLLPSAKTNLTRKAELAWQY